MLYLDKNADVGVSFRRAGFRERFPEAPRDGYSFTVNLSVQELWDAVVSTDAFREEQEVSNCQHFVKECLTELASRGHLGCEGKIDSQGAAGDFTLRNQWVADVLRRWGYLDQDCKAPGPGPEGGQQLWRLAMSWGCKIGSARWASPWAESFTLLPADVE
eukprot:TRINITY_DN109053_c0_g1_i1.p2 TRINITY_DN109053_c0_g1~~TRINITY_DN109053_c0_g1_i1.p2  ORF type:complete len:160 (-),score=42.39 TRINITY_DN109053_c0_g1_i1:1-480(-)